MPFLIVIVGERFSREQRKDQHKKNSAVELYEILCVAAK